jgi:arabinofuranan 3-O-arabinosyltransferase
MSDVLETLRSETDSDRRSPRLLGIFAAWRLQAYGYGCAFIYAVLLVHFYHIGAWLVDGTGLPVYIDFTCAWVAGSQVLQGQAASIYDPAEFLKVQDALVGAGHSAYPYWPYPPIYFLILAPLAMLPYVAAFLTWDLVTLVGCIAVVYLIVRRRAAIALVLASPFAAWNLIDGQSGFLTASLLGASLLVLERRPVLAGVFIGCLTYKPQFGILIPVALVALGQWRAFASAAATTAFLVGTSAAAFGIDIWGAFPRAFIGHTGGILLHDPENTSMFYWGHLQTIYGLIRTLHGGAVLAWFAQGVTALAVAIIIWLVWRSPARYALKAATLSAAALIATPYAQTYDFAAIAIPVAFLARDQIACGLLRGEQTIMLALFGASLGVLVALASVPLGPVIVIALFAIILRRVFYHRRQSASAAFAIIS